MEKHILTFLLVGSLILNQSCSKDDPTVDPVDTEKPVITLITPTTTTTKVWGTVAIKAEATDNTGITVINVFIDGASIASAASSPAEASWDSNLVSDGTHELKVVAEDTDGNTNEVKFNFEVMNDLFVFHVSAEYIIEGYFKKWFFISDNQGNALLAKQMENGQNYVVKTPASYEEGTTYTVSEFVFSEEGNEYYNAKFYDFSSYTEMIPGEYTFHRTPNTGVTSLGKYTLSIENYDGGPLNTAGAFGENAYNGNFHFMVDHYEFEADVASTTSDLTYYLFWNPPTPPKYLYLDNVAPEGTLTVDYSEFSDMTLHTTLDLPGATETIYDLTAFNSSGKSIFMYTDNSVYSGGDPEALKIWVPDLVYPRYQTSVLYYKGDDSYTYTITDAQPPLSIGEVSATVNSFSRSSNALSATLTEKVDRFRFYSVSYEEPEPDHSLNYSWGLYGAGNLNISLEQPQIPAEIVQAYPELDGYEFTITSYELTNSSKWDNYQDFLEEQFSVPIALTGKVETLQKWQGAESTSGRKKSPAQGRRNPKTF